MIKKFIENRINNIVNSTIEKKKEEISERINKEVEEYTNKKKEEYQKLTYERDELIKKVEYEKNKLSEILDIVRQNLTAEEIWLKLWSVAFDKAMDIAWDLMKEKTIELIEKEKETAYDKAKEEFEVIIEKRNKELEEKLSSMEVNKMTILNLKDEAGKNLLIYQKSKDEPRQQYYQGQLDFIKKVLSEK